MHAFFYISGIVLWIGIAMLATFYIGIIIIALSIPNEKDNH